jgi:hypothetical protein
MNSSVTSDTRNVTASKTSATPMPAAEAVVALPLRAAITMPAATGPTSTVICAVPWTIPFARCSWSSLTSSGTIAVWAGKKNASATPNTRANA